jgi:hypothetical protein
LSVEEASGPPIEVWPDNLPAVNLFIAMGTQWRVGMSGVTGLDYNALPAVMRMTGVKSSDMAEVFNDLRVLEDAALEKMRAKK